MIGIVLVSHGDLGRELLNAAELICGQHDQVAVLGLQAGDAIDALPDRIREAIDGLGSVDGVLVLVDLFGGSPANATLRVLAEANIECVSGVNLPMLLEVLMMREGLDAGELAVLALQAGQQGMQNLGQRLRDQMNA
ncbi:MAG: PTS sugar transporter subunit IIA [Anaerolineae bacterium]